MRQIILGTAAVASVIVLAAAAGAVAQAPEITPPLPGVPMPADVSLDPTTLPAGVYDLDGRHANLSWRIRHTGLSLFVGRMDTMSGKLTFDPKAPAGSTIEVKVAANSVDTNVIASDGQHAFDKVIASEAFGAEAHPDITFVSKTVKLTGPRTGLVSGDLTLRGVTKPVVMDVTFDGGKLVELRHKPVMAITGRTVIHRSAFEAKLGNALRDSTVGDEVEIILSAEFVKS